MEIGWDMVGLAVKRKPQSVPDGFSIFARK